MKIFLDSCDLKEIKRINDLGIISGFTTTPTFAVREKLAYQAKMIDDIHKIVGNTTDVYYTVASSDYDEIIRVVKDIDSDINPETRHHTIYKLSTSYAAIKATKTLADSNHRTALHLIYSPNQALLASKSKAENIFPLLGRSDDMGGNGIKLVRDIKTAYDENHIGMNMIAASVRNLTHISEMFKLGIYGITIPSNLFDKLITHPLTTSGIEEFRRDYFKAKEFEN